MLEKYKAVNNPLTIIALFAGLAEIAFTVSLGLVDKSLQTIFIWFVMVFPTLLVILFFTTLNFNPRVLYSPSDYKDEENFVSVLIGTKKIRESLDQVSQQFDEVREQILQQSEVQIKSIGEQEKEKLTKIIDDKLNKLDSGLESVRIEAKSVESSASAIQYPMSSILNSVMTFLNKVNEFRSVEQISRVLRRNPSDIQNALSFLMDAGLISEQQIGEVSYYRSK